MSFSSMVKTMGEGERGIEGMRVCSTSVARCARFCVLTLAGCCYQYSWLAVLSCCAQHVVLRASAAGERARAAGERALDPSERCPQRGHAYDIVQSSEWDCRQKQLGADRSTCISTNEFVYR